MVATVVSLHSLSSTFLGEWVPESFKGTCLLVIFCCGFKYKWALIEILSGHLVDPEAAVFLCGSMEQCHEFH